MQGTTGTGLCCDADDLVRQCNEQQKDNMSVSSWAKELIDELYGNGLAFVFRKQQL
jgi:hypothetical protein